MSIREHTYAYVRSLRSTPSGAPCQYPYFCTRNCVGNCTSNCVSICTLVLVKNKKSEPERCRFAARGPPQGCRTAPHQAPRVSICTLVLVNNNKANLRAIKPPVSVFVLWHWEIITKRVKRTCAPSSPQSSIRRPFLTGTFSASVTVMVFSEYFCVSICKHTSAYVSLHQRHSDGVL